MRKVLSIVFGLIIIAGISSCKKCTTCEIKKLDGTVEAQYEEYCGSKKEIEDFKKSLEEKTLIHLGSNGQVVCVDK